MVSSQTKEIQLNDLMPAIREQLAAGNNVRLFPKGTSMLPMLRQGIDSVILSPTTNKLKKYDLPLYQRENGQYVLHRIVEVGETYTCVGDNQFAYEYGIRHDQMIAVVTEFLRGNKRIHVDHLSYQFYCRLWHYSRSARGLCYLALVRLRRLFK